MQGIADIQMHKFRKNRNGSFIRVGLWKYSRHPNYLGEILMWWGVGLSVVFACPSAWYLLVGAIANTVLFLVVSIPMADKRQSKKDGFVEYKKQTRMLLPIKKI
jgi:steroid 5-alpha reductase family enzyme